MDQLITAPFVLSSVIAVDNFYTYSVVINRKKQGTSYFLTNIVQLFVMHVIAWDHLVNITANDYVNQTLIVCWVKLVINRSKSSIYTTIHPVVVFY